MVSRLAWQYQLGQQFMNVRQRGICRPRGTSSYAHLAEARWEKAKGGQIRAT